MKGKNSKIYPLQDIQEPSFDIDELIHDIDSELDHKSINVSRNEHNDEEVKFVHETVDGNAIIMEELKAKFTDLSVQLNEIKNKLNKSLEKTRELENSRIVLEERNLDLEEENKVLQGVINKSITNDGTSTRIVNGKAGGKQTKNAAIRSEDIRKALLVGDDFDVFGNIEDIIGKNSFIDKFRIWILRVMPFKGEIKKTQARFGASVAAYFQFYRFLFLQFLILLFVGAFLLIFHVLYVILKNKSSSLWSSPGLVPGFMLYSSFQPSEGVYYTTAVVAGTLIIIVTTINKLVQEDKIEKELDLLEQENGAPFSSEIFCAWDFSLVTQVEAEDNSGSLCQRYLQLMDEAKSLGIKKARSRIETIALYLRRFVGFVSYLVVQAASFALIIYLTIYSSYVASKLKHFPLLNNFSSFVAPLCLNLISSATPMFLVRITSIELWDSAQTEVNILIFRMFFSNTLNILLLALSYVLLSNPFLLANYPLLRSSLEVQFSGTFTCRLDQTSDGVFTLVVSNVFVSAASAYASSAIAPKILNYLFHFPIVKQEFSIASNIVQLQNFINIALLSFPFVPLGIILVPLFIYLNAKFDYFMIMQFQCKPKRPWKAQKAGKVFTTFYLLSLFLVAIPASLFFLSTRTFPKSCSIQDNYVNLCSSDGPSVSECVTNPNSIYYSAYGTGYPGNICDSACGPFVDDTSALSPFKQAIFSVNVLYYLWTLCFSYPYIPWLVLSILCIELARQMNSWEIITSSHDHKVKHLEGLISGLETEKKKQSRMIEKLRSVENDSHE